MFIPYNNKEIRVVKCSQLYKYYTKIEIENIYQQLNEEIIAWGQFLNNVDLTSYWVCIIDKSAVHRLNVFYDNTYEVKRAIDNNKHLLVSVLLLKKYVVKCSLFRFIQCVSTIVSHCSFGTYIIKEVQRKIKIWLIPFDIIESSVEYWIKYLLREYGLNTVEDYIHFLKRHNLINIVSWNPLLNVKKDAIITG